MIMFFILLLLSFNYIKCKSSITYDEIYLQNSNKIKLNSMYTYIPIVMEHLNTNNILGKNINSDIFYPKNDTDIQQDIYRIGFTIANESAKPNKQCFDNSPLIAMLGNLIILYISQREHISKYFCMYSNNKCML